MSYLARHRPICVVIGEIRDRALRNNDTATVQLCDEALDYARRMSARLMEYKRAEADNN